jgi:aminoglycoside phosphotransferase
VFEPPASVRARFDGATWSERWDHRFGTTWHVEHHDGTAYFLKVRVAGAPPTVFDEAARMRWLHDFLPVPQVVEVGVHDDVEWLLTEALDGVDAVLHPLRESDPELVVTSIARSLHTFHEHAPVASCPFDFRLAVALEHVRQRVGAGLVHASDFHDEFEHFTVDEAAAELERLAPRIAAEGEDTVVSHGDPCFPNFLLDDSGVVTGYIDLGEVAVAPRDLDLAIGSWSCTWNVGPGYEEMFYDGYGKRPAPEAITFYRLLAMLREG